MDAESIAGLVGLAIGLLVLLALSIFESRAYKRLTTTTTLLPPVAAPSRRPGRYWRGPASIPPHARQRATPPPDMRTPRASFSCRQTA